MKFKDVLGYISDEELDFLSAETFSRKSISCYPSQELANMAQRPHVPVMSRQQRAAYEAMVRTKLQVAKQNCTLPTPSLQIILHNHGFPHLKHVKIRCELLRSKFLGMCSAAWQFRITEN